MKRNARILVIDDEEGIRFTFEKFLRAEGHFVDTASCWTEFIGKVDSVTYDLIFSDIVMEGKSGIDILREIKRRELLCPVVLITAHPDLDTTTDGLRLDAYDYIVKPVRKHTLLRVAELALRHKELIDEKEQIRANLEAIFTSVQDGIILVDKNMNLVEANTAAEKICGFGRDYLGSSLAAVERSCGDKCLIALRETIAKKCPVRLRRIECSRGERPGQVVSVTTSPVFASADDCAGAVMAARDETDLATMESDLKKHRGIHHIIGKSDGMQRVYSLIKSLGEVKSSVLITGESGTGKELAADAIHNQSDRRNKPYVKVNCAALTQTLLESELFGHVRGAFTGAVRDKAGRFELADGGTLFLDEIGDISMGLQMRLLRALQQKEFERVGDSKSIKVDVRIIAATNQNLRERVERGEYREDLYYRLKVIELHLPPLRERKEDIPLLAEHFIQKFNYQFGKRIDGLSADAMKLFLDYSWKGNIRELEHAIEHAFVLCRQSTITVNDLPHEMTIEGIVSNRVQVGADLGERETILAALEKTNGNKTMAARLLGVSRQTIYRKIEQYGIPAEHGVLNP